MNDVAIWRRLDLPGHDAAILTQRDSGWLLRGAAVFKHEAGPACISYSVDIGSSWVTRGGRVEGFLGDRKLSHAISREADGWHLDGVLIDGLAHLSDLDYSFTPATNLQQLRRVALMPGQAVELPVAWFDVDLATLTELPQRYERRDETTYHYEAPTVPYEGRLELSSSGFVKAYPGLWRMEA